MVLYPPLDAWYVSITNHLCLQALYASIVVTFLPLNAWYESITNHLCLQALYASIVVTFPPLDAWYISITNYLCLQAWTEFQSLARNASPRVLTPYISFIDEWDSAYCFIYKDSDNGKLHTLPLIMRLITMICSYSSICIAIAKLSLIWFLSCSDLVYWCWFAYITTGDIRCVFRRGTL